MKLELKQAERKHSKIRLGLYGKSGAGKTYSSLVLGYGLCGDWKKVALIDTESSGEIYSSLGEYNVVKLEQPYTPDSYIEAITLCERSNMDLIIIDSLSHFWMYLLDLHSSLQGQNFRNWHPISKLYNKVIGKILNSSCHIITTVRLKESYLMNMVDGKYEVEKVGLKGIIRNTYTFELTTAFNLDTKHKACVIKDRMQIFANDSEFIITENTGRRIRDWYNLIPNEEEVKNLISKASSLDDLHQLYQKYPTHQQSLNRFFTAKKAELEKKPINNHLKTQPNGTIS